MRETYFSVYFFVLFKLCNMLIYLVYLIPIFFDQLKKHRKDKKQDETLVSYSSSESKLGYSSNNDEAFLNLTVWSVSSTGFYSLIRKTPH